MAAKVAVSVAQQEMEARAADAAAAVWPEAAAAKPVGVLTVAMAAVPAVVESSRPPGQAAAAVAAYQGWRTHKDRPPTITAVEVEVEAAATGRRGYRCSTGSSRRSREVHQRR